ncbi:MAG: hypothetical protein Q7J35_11595 [Candidatus Methanoperedens sp.]|nr:hypothetical protein [Candidatus Methanoperedens sp.]
MNNIKRILVRLFISLFIINIIIHTVYAQENNTTELSNERAMILANPPLIISIIAIIISLGSFYLTHLRRGKLKILKPIYQLSTKDGFIQLPLILRNIGTRPLVVSNLAILTLKGEKEDLFKWINIQESLPPLDNITRDDIHITIGDFGDFENQPRTLYRIDGYIDRGGKRLPPIPIFLKGNESYFGIFTFVHEKNKEGKQIQFDGRYQILIKAWIDDEMEGKIYLEFGMKIPGFNEAIGA